MNKDMNELLALLELVPEAKAFVGVLFAAVGEFEEEWCTVIEFIANTQVHAVVTMYNGFIENNIPADHALSLTLAAMNNLRQGIENGLKSAQ